MSTEIIIKSSDGEIATLILADIETITLQKGDYVYISEYKNSVKLKIVNDTLEIIFLNNKSILIENMVTLLKKNDDEILNGLMDKLDITAIAFWDDNGDFKEISLYEELIDLIKNQTIKDDKIKPNNINPIIDNPNENIDLPNDIVWGKSEKQIKDGDDVFDVLKSDNITVYLDKNITATNIQ